MMKLVQFIVAAFVLIFVLAVPTVMALPNAQGFPCFGGEGCPEPVNPEPDEYYAVQCTTNAVWVWVAVPGPTLVTFVSLFQIDALSDGASLVAPNNVTIARSGDTITLSGENGNFAPQPGEKSFSWSECVERNGGLPELPPIGRELTDAEIECMNLPTEQEKSDCLNALAPATNVPSCEDQVYRALHAEECVFVSCPGAPDFRVLDPSECPDSLYILYEEINAILEFCLGPPVTVGIVFFPFAVFRRRRKQWLNSTASRGGRR